jgi:hypothetical protein
MLASDDYHGEEVDASVEYRSLVYAEKIDNSRISPVYP